MLLLSTQSSALFCTWFSHSVLSTQHSELAFTQHSALDPQSSALSTPHVPSGYKSAWAQYSVLAKDEAHRAALLKRMQEAKIPTAIYYPKPLHLQTAFAFLGYAHGAFPVSEDTANRIFSLPMHPYLVESDQERIITALT